MYNFFYNFWSLICSNNPNENKPSLHSNINHKIDSLVELNSYLESILKPHAQVVLQITKTYDFNKNLKEIVATFWPQRTENFLWIYEFIAKDDISFKKFLKLITIYKIIAITNLKKTFNLNETIEVLANIIFDPQKQNINDEIVLMLNRRINNFLVCFFCDFCIKNYPQSFLANFFTGFGIISGNNNIRFLTGGVLTVIFATQEPKIILQNKTLLKKAMFETKTTTEFVERVEQILNNVKGFLPENMMQKLQWTHNDLQTIYKNRDQIDQYTIYKAIKNDIDMLGLKHSSNLHKILKPYEIPYHHRLNFQPQNLLFSLGNPKPATKGTKAMQNYIIKNLTLCRGQFQNWTTIAAAKSENKAVQNKLIKDILKQLNIFFWPVNNLSAAINYSKTYVHSSGLLDIYLENKNLSGLHRLLIEIFPQLSEQWSDLSNIQTKINVFKTAILLLNIYNNLRQLPNREEVFQEILKELKNLKIIE